MRSMCYLVHDVKKTQNETNKFERQPDPETAENVSLLKRPSTSGIAAERAGPYTDAFFEL